MIKNYLRKIYTYKQISYLINLLASPWKGRGAILLYHRVLPEELIKEDLDLGLAVSNFNFEKQIKTLKSKYKIVSMDEFISNLKRETNQFMITITFDDGYNDNLFHALPILEKYEIPALLYMTTRFLNDEVCMWWYELKDTIENRSTLNFEYENKSFKFMLKNREAKLSAYENLRKLFLNLKFDKQINLIEQITETKKRKNYSNICLKPKELKVLDNNPLITIGSHSHNHLNLKILSNEEVVYEVKKSLEILENLLNRKVKHFAYPFGGKDQAFLREYKMIQDLNFNSAVTGRVYPIKNCNLYSLPRIYVGRNTNERALVNHLSGFYNMINKFF